ncbi:MAG: hypothetical protein U0228_35540 [Myxococcaceae bacterium]
MRSSASSARARSSASFSFAASSPTRCSSSLRVALMRSFSSVSWSYEDFGPMRTMRVWPLTVTGIEQAVSAPPERTAAASRA